MKFALQRNYTIVSSNHDLLMESADQGCRFVWLDPMGLGAFTMVETALLVLSQFGTWDRLLTDWPTHSLRARRSMCDAVDPQELARLATNRYRNRLRRDRHRSRTSATTTAPRLDL